MRFCSHWSPYRTQAWFMGKAEGSCDKEVGRSKEVPPYPAAFSGTGEHGAPKLREEGDREATCWYRR